MQLSELGLTKIGFDFSDNQMEFRLSRYKYLIWDDGDTFITLYDEKIEPNFFPLKNINTLEKVEQLINDICQ